MRKCLALVFLLTGCGPAPTDPGPGGLMVEDAKALDEAAARLEEQQADPKTLSEQVDE